jgi:hypothetical protein
VILLRVLGLLVATGFCASAARALQQRLCMESRSAGLLVFLLLMTAIQSLFILAAGLTGTLSFWPLTAASAAGLVLLQFQRPRLIVQFKLPSAASGWLILSIAAAGFLSLLMKTFLLTPYTGDALMYHLPKIAEWVQAGRFVSGINHDPRQWFCSGFELIETWWVVFLRHDALIELGGLQMTLIATAAVYSLAETFDARPDFAALVYLLLPATLLNATSCGNDLAVAALTLSGYALIAAGAPRPIQALPLLMVIGIKATGIFAIAGLALFACFQNRPAKLPLWGAVTLVGAGLLLAGFWYVRNLVIAGHPLYPFYGNPVPFTWQQGRVDLESLQSTAQAIPRRLTDPWPFESLSPNASGWGWAVLPLGLPAILLTLREDRRYRTLALSFLVGACVTLSCVYDDGMNFRFILWFPALFSLSIARRRAPLWMAAALLACTVNLLATLIPNELRYSRHIQAPLSLPPNEPVACVFTLAVPSYRLYNHDFSRRVSYPRSMEELRRSGAKYVYLYDPPEWAQTIHDWPSIGGRFHEVP